MDLVTCDLNGTFDGSNSSMTLHHIKDIERILSKFHSYLSEGGFLAVSDLDLENRSFHKEDAGVHHFGFDRDQLIKAAEMRIFIV